MSGKVQTAYLEAGLVIAASRSELKIGTIPSAHHVPPFSSDMVMAVCRAIVENWEECNND